MTDPTRATTPTDLPERLGRPQFLKLVLSGAVLEVTLARPPVNAVSQAMYRELTTLFSAIGAPDDGIKGVLLFGEGRHFCAGNDLEEFATLSPDNGAERMAEVHAAFSSIRNCAVPVLAGVHGAALGTGLCIAAACDIIVCADDASFGLPEVTVGVMGGAKHLSRLVPEHVMRRAYFTGLPIELDDIVRHGAIATVVASDDLQRTARVYIQDVVANSRSALQAAKHSLNAIEFMDLDAGYAYEQTLTVELSGHPDSKEALSAIRERRTASFTDAPFRAPAR